MTMHLKTVQPRQGIQWVRLGLRVFFKQPLGYVSMMALLGLAMLLFVQLPLIGSVAAMALMPLATVGFMTATREVLAGRRAHPGHLLAPLRHADARRAVLQCGLAYAVTALVVVLLADVLDGGRFRQAVEAVAESASDASVLEQPGVETSVLVRSLLLSILSLVFWHVPALMVWGRQPLHKAVFFSALACWRHLGAFMLMGLTWFGLLLLIVMLTQIVFGLLQQPQGVVAFILPAGMLFSTAFYASIYFTFVDAFGAIGSTPKAEAAGGDDAPPTA